MDKVAAAYIRKGQGVSAFARVVRLVVSFDVVAASNSSYINIACLDSQLRHPIVIKLRLIQGDFIPEEDGISCHQHAAVHTLTCLLPDRLGSCCAAFGTAVHFYAACEVCCVCPASEGACLAAHQVTVLCSWGLNSL